jgi:hypothetical protein
VQGIADIRAAFGFTRQFCTLLTQSVGKNVFKSDRRTLTIVPQLTKEWRYFHVFVVRWALGIFLAENSAVLLGCGIP